MVLTRKQRASSIAGEDDNGEQEVKPKKDEQQKDEEESFHMIIDKVGTTDERKKGKDVIHSRISKKKEITAQSQRQKKERNALTNLIPGYTAERSLNTSSLDKYRTKGGIQGLRRKAESSKSATSTSSFMNLAQRERTTATSFKKGSTTIADPTAGKGWFGFVPTPMTDELKTDLAVIRNRNYLDPKKFYKNPDKPGSFVQLGTVIEGATEFYSSRLTNKQRRTNLTDEILADPETANYAKRKFKEFSQQKTEAALKRQNNRKKGRKFY